jgi:hypothetical protein
MQTKGNGPVTNGTAPQNHNHTDFNRLLGLHRAEPLTREDREDIELLIRAAERGFRLSTSCVDCGHPISSPSSVRRHRGPKCHARAVTE